MTTASTIVKRQLRVRSSIKSSSTRLRLSVHRTNQHIYAQIIDDTKGKTLVAVSDLNLKTKPKGGKTKTALAVGKQLAETAKTKKITQVVFDRGRFRYHGRVKAVAQGARQADLKF